MDEELLDDNFQQYFSGDSVDDKNDGYVLNILSKDGEIEDVILGLDNIKKYISNERKPWVRTKESKRTTKRNI